MTRRTSPDLPARGEFVVRGAHVLSMDQTVGDVPSGDVHVRDGAIVAVGPHVTAPGAEQIDGTGTICMPGFVETHWHLWTGVLRPVVRQDDPKQSYFPVTATLGAHYRPEDSYRAVRMGLAEALSAGVTTVHNWAHNVRSPAHADAELSAMRDTGIRGRFSYGTPCDLANDEPMDLADLQRVRRELAGDRMLTLGICSRNVGSDPNPLRGTVTVDMAQQEWGAARQLGLPITLHTSGPPVTDLIDGAGLLGPDVQFVHPLNTSAEDRAILAERGVSYSTSGTGEARRSGDIQLSELLEAGVRTAISIDHTTTYSCDCFVCMRMLYSLNLHRQGKQITARRMVQLATIDGAVDLGIAGETGSLTPGKRADLILVRTTDVNMAAMGDPYDALVALAEPANVDTVMVDGRILRRGSEYTALDHGEVIAAGMESAAKLRERARWPA
ncbi:MAG TPA: amidohydrolase family protein [Candidatus Binatia bacterium]|nr:amidohydrolase family protein [Candidatus Binatia bacterium]